MNRFLLLIGFALVGIFVASCAENPQRVVPDPAHGSASRTPYRPAKRHHIVYAQVPLRHPPASEGRRRLLPPRNYLPAASETLAPTNATIMVAPAIPAPANATIMVAPEPPAPVNATTKPPLTYEIGPYRYRRWEE